MRSANYVEETTTSIAGTSGDGAVTLTAVTNIPRFSTVFGTQATTMRYVIEDTVNKKFETGIGSVASNVLTRTLPQITWDGTTYDDSAPSALQFGSSPTSGNIKIRMSAVAESQAANVPARQSTITGDTTWRDYPMSAVCGQTNSGTGNALTADREYYSVYKLETSGLLSGIQFDCTTGVASSNMKIALYACGSNGLPGAKIVDFTTTSTASTAVKTDTATGSWTPAGPVWLTPGWYYIGFINSHTAAIRGFGGISSNAKPTPLGRQSSYGYGETIYVAGSYSTGLPANPSPTTMLGSSNTLSSPWFGLKVVA